MTPYYQDDWVTIYHGDCRTVTAWLAADVLATDPPYGTRLMSAANGNAGGYGRRQCHGRGRDGFVIANDDDTQARDEALAMWGERPALVFGSPRMPEPPGIWVDRLVWDKKRLGMNGGPWRYQHESVFVSEGFRRVTDDFGSIISEFPEQTEHVHAKPLPLMARLLRCAPEGVIADPFAGSGSTLRAAKDLGRHAIGVEIEERYCEIAARRCSQEVLDLWDQS